MGRNIDNHYIQIKLNEAVSLAEQIYKIINDDTVQPFVLENTDEAISELLRWLKKDLHQINYSTTQSQNTLDKVNNKSLDNEAAPENLKEGDHITDANGTEHVVLGHKDGNLILETMDGKKSEVPYSVVEKELAGGTAHISSTNVTIPKEPENDDHFGEEQAEGLSNLLEGLKDTPHDNRW